MIAGFIILRLRNILGRKTGHEDKVFSNFTEKNFENFRKNETKPKAYPSDKLEGEEKESFLKGAEIAYETILTSFAKGEKDKLKKLLTPHMSENFESAITQRQKDGITSELTFISMKETKLEKFERIKNQMFATVKLVSEIISVKRDKNNKIIEGNPDKIKLVTDHWKFSKNIFSKNPNWYLSDIIGK